MAIKTNNLRIVDKTKVLKPEDLMANHKISDDAANTVASSREKLIDILDGKDDRLMVLVGPCSIHDTKAGLEYAQKLVELREELKDDLMIVMRVYFEKPRTTVGWKGLINDPDINDTFDINKGLGIAREFLLNVAELGLPAGTEFLDLITPQYYSDLITWGAIGARTTESQGHREMVSGLSCPIGYKNGTSGDVQIAIDACRASASPHNFVSVTGKGNVAIFKTAGNKDTHIILRGGQQPNYSAASVDDAAALLEKAGIPQRIMIDTSHANCRKIFERQVDLAEDIASQLSKGDKRIFSVMMESHLVEGRQNAEPGKELTYGQSITDPCLGWDATVGALKTLAEGVRNRRKA